MSVAQPLLATIEADEPSVTSSAPRPPVASQTSHSPRQLATTETDAESGISGIFRQSAHPLALFFLYFFRIAAISVYILCGWFTSDYVLSTVLVLVLLAMDFWNCRNVSGRTLVGLRFWNQDCPLYFHIRPVFIHTSFQVDDDGDSYWVFESRDPSRPANPVDSKMFWIALYVFPLLWAALLIVSLLKLGFAFIPIVVLALVFNLTNVIGFTYADRDAKQKWANGVVGGGWGLGLGGIGGQILTGAMKKSVGRVFG